MDDKIKNCFKTWECFVVWNKDKALIRRISAYYNRVNHFMNTNPTWATNIIGAREIWISLGRPENPKEATEVGRALAPRNAKGKKPSKDAYNEFMEAAKLRFALIDVKGAQKAVSSIKSGKDKLNIQNELKIITAPDEVYNVWSEFISTASHGELIDPNSGRKMKELGKWKPDLGVISREFFWWIGNTSYEQLKRLAEHLPNLKQFHAYPKCGLEVIGNLVMGEVLIV